MGFEPATLAAQADDFELEGLGLAGADAFVQLFICLPVLGRDEVENGVAGDLRQALRPDHGEARGVHVEKRAVCGYQLDALGLRIEYCPEMGVGRGTSRGSTPGIQRAARVVRLDT